MYGECPNCRTPLQQWSRFCPNCGASLTSEQSNQTVSANDVQNSIPPQPFPGASHNANPINPGNFNPQHPPMQSQTPGVQGTSGNFNPPVSPPPYGQGSGVQPGGTYPRKNGGKKNTALIVIISLLGVVILFLGAALVSLIVLRNKPPENVDVESSSTQPISSSDHTGQAESTEPSRSDETEISAEPSKSEAPTKAPDPTEPTARGELSTQELKERLWGLWIPSTDLDGENNIIDDLVYEFWNFREKVFWGVVPGEIGRPGVITGSRVSPDGTYFIEIYYEETEIYGEPEPAVTNEIQIEFSGEDFISYNSDGTKTRWIYYCEDISGLNLGN